MNEKEIDSLILELHDVASDAFGKYISLDAIAERTRGIDYIFIVRDDNGRAVGYASNEILLLNGMEVNYFASAMIRKEYQDRGIYSHLKDLRVNVAGTDVLMTRTQNPKVYRSFGQVCKHGGYQLYPNGLEIPKTAIELARSYCPNTDNMLIVKNAYYGEALMKKTPEPLSEEEKKIWSKMDVNKGDAVILIGLR